MKGDRKYMRITDFPLVQEVKDEYLALRKTGKSRADAILEMQQQYRNELEYGSEDDALLFWVGLADAQYSAKELTLDVTGKAAAALHKIADSDCCVAQGDIDRRLAHYHQAPQPEKKFGKPKAKFRCSWEIGDTFAYKLPENTEDGKANANYILLRKVSDIESGDGSLYAAVTLSLWKNSLLPQSVEEFCSVPLLRVNRKGTLLPSGFYEYRCELIVKSKRHLDSAPLIYLGCFNNVSAPEDEGIIDHPGKMTLLLLDYLDRDLPLLIKRSRFYEEEVRKIKSN